jgi:NADH-quinone oxidoreductase subunit E
MLNPKETEEILHEISICPYPAAACIDALKIVQSHRGWISDESVEDIAQILEMSANEVDSIATFYTRIYRKPVGRNIILICDSVSCMIMDYESIYKYVSGKLGIRFGETTKDRRFTLLPITCLGDCDHAPSFMINNDLYNNLSIEKLDSLLEKYQ